MSRPPHATRTVPLGIKIIVVLGGLGSILALFSGLALSLFSVGGFETLLGIIVAVFAVVKFVTLIGLWSLKRWAWTAAMVIYTLSALLDLLRVNIVGLLIAIIILAYVYSQRHLFR